MVRILGEFSKVDNDACEAIIIDMSLYSNAQPQVLAVLTSFIKKYENNKTIFTYFPNNNDVKNYMARMEFYNKNRFEVEYPYNKFDSTGRFIELTEFNNGNMDEIIAQLSQIFANPKLNVIDDMQRVLAFCMSEIADNCCCHSLSKTDNYICAQVYADRVSICIVDSGIGITGSLREVKEYSNLTNRELIAKSVMESVTSKNSGRIRTHQGFGLYAVNEIIKMNRGVLEVYTNDVALITRDGATDIINIPSWDGTIVHISLNRSYDADAWKLILRDIFLSRGHEEPYMSHLDDQASEYDFF